MYKFVSLAIVALLSTSSAINVDKKSASQSFYVLVEEPTKPKSEQLTQQSSEEASDEKIETQEEPAKAAAKEEAKAPAKEEAKKEGKAEGKAPAKEEKKEAAANATAEASADVFPPKNVTGSSEIDMHTGSKWNTYPPK